MPISLVFLYLPSLFLLPAARRYIASLVFVLSHLSRVLERVRAGVVPCSSEFPFCSARGGAGREAAEDEAKPSC